jgi:hypothetical protein
MIRREVDYERQRRKNGTLGLRLDMVLRPYCQVAVCDYCGRLSNADHVRKWWLLPFELAWELLGEEPRLCMGCMNRLRPTADGLHESEECRLLIGRIERACTNAKKRHQDHG